MTHHSEPAEAVALVTTKTEIPMTDKGLGAGTITDKHPSRYINPDAPVWLLPHDRVVWSQGYAAALATPAPSASGGLEAANKAEAILRQVRKFIAAEDKHARLSEQGRNTSRDDVDFEHSLVVGFTVQDCDEALRIVKRRAAAPATPAPSASGGLEAVRGLLPEDQPNAWPPLKKALWLVVTGERLNDGRYVNAYELTDKLYAAALAAPAPSASGGLEAAWKQWSSENWPTERAPSYVYAAFFEGARAALSAPAATSGEPVAWFCGGCGETDPSKRCLGCLHGLEPYAPPAPAVESAQVKALLAKAEAQVEYWNNRQRNEKALEEATDDDGNHTPLGDGPAWSAGYCNGRYSEADWWLKTIRASLATDAEG